MTSRHGVAATSFPKKDFCMNEGILYTTYMYIHAQWSDLDDIKEALSVLMLCTPSNGQRPFSYYTKMVDFQVFSCFVCFLEEKTGINSEECIEYGK